MEIAAATSADSRPVPAPLLPTPLLAPAAVLWLWVLPVAILGLLNLHGYWLVGSELNEQQRGSALLLGWAGLANLLAGAGVFYLIRFPQRGSGLPSVDHPAWGVPAVLVQVGYLWLAASNLAEGMLPPNITAWIYPESRFMFNQFTFCMLPAFHGILRLAGARAPKTSARTLGINLGLAVGGPIVLYLVFSVASSLGSGRSFSWAPYFFATLIIVAGIVMFFGVLRVLLVALRFARSWHVTAERWAVVIFALALPFAGLALNRAIPFPVDFQALEVYVLTTANAFVMLFAVWQGASRPRLSWFLLCATLPFSLYFFVVFLPFTPLSVLAVIALGTGFLVLTPTLLFGLQLHLLASAWRHAGGAAARRSLLLGGALCVMILPAFFTVRGLADKAALNAALDYLYEPAVPAGDVTFGSSLTNLRRAVNSHRSYKAGLYYPLLSDYYAWLVFDNLVLPDSKLAEIERTFFGAPQADGKIDPFRQDRGVWSRGHAGARMRPPRVREVPQTVDVSEPLMRTAPADTHSMTVTLTTTLKNTGPVAAEHVTALNLPAGVFVSGFRLQVGETFVPGRIFEKKTALWVYTMIRDAESRDPGLLFYKAPTELELRVFPILPGKPVTVEIDFLVPGNVAAADLTPTGQTLNTLLAALGRTMHPSSARSSSGDVVVAGLENKKLPVAHRESYLHLIIDRSAKNGFEGDLAAIVPALRAKFPEAKRVRVTAANFEVTTISPALTTWETLPPITAAELRHTLPLSGGLALDLALAHAVRMHRDSDLERNSPDGVPPQPVFVVLGRGATSKPVELPLASAWADLLPGLELAEFGADGSFAWLRHDNAARPNVLLRAGNSIRPLVANRLVRFAENLPGAGMQYWDETVSAWRRVRGEVASADDSAWGRAAGLQLRQQDRDRDPRGSAIDRRGLIKASRESGTLIASASYIVVENQAQWKMLETGERQKLGQNQALDFVETPAPPALWVAIAFVAWLAFRRKFHRARRGSSWIAC